MAVVCAARLATTSCVRLTFPCDVVGVPCGAQNALLRKELAERTLKSPGGGRAEEAEEAEGTGGSKASRPSKRGHPLRRAM